MSRNPENCSKERGSAMVVAIVVSMVIMVASLTLLLVTYSLYASVQENTGLMQCRELAVSLSDEVGQEIMKGSPGQRDGQGGDFQSSLYSYLRANLCQEQVWPRYEPAGTEKLEACSKYFMLEIPPGYEDMADEILMTLYWTGEACPIPDEEKEESLLDEIGNGGQASDSLKEHGQVVLHVKIRVSKGGTSYTRTQAYALEVSRESQEEILTETAYGTTIDSNENWSFSVWQDLNTGALGKQVRDEEGYRM